MDKNFKLTIAVITMNRADQLMQALESCIACKLPENTGFVIVDNASSDNTPDVTNEFAENNSDYTVRIKRVSENLGVGGGRSLAFDLARGDYVYFLDDDAIIADDCRETFFVDTLDYFDRNENVASITTRGYDEMWGCDRDANESFKKTIDGLPTVFKFLGYSHFLRRNCFEKPLYFDIKYGGEEYAPSIKAQNKGYYHVFDEHVYIIHKPKVNKWIQGTSDHEYVESCGCAVVYATKRKLYPTVFLPLLWCAYKCRCNKYLKQYPDAQKKTDALVKEILQNNTADKVSHACVIKMVKNFGLTVL